MSLIIIVVRSTRKRSQIFGLEEPNLIAIRTKSYRPKNQILLPEDMAAFFMRHKCIVRDIHKCIIMQSATACNKRGLSS